jgi:hypothetical protein|tara:strand:- start:1342 stop:1728 length:387 start_codon:yes stop_codon:yes gene_type:complete
MATAEQQNAFRAFVMEVIENLATAVYQQSQELVPVVTGELKSSGSLTKTADGYEIKYAAPYASLIDGMGEDSTFIVRDSKLVRFPKAPRNASGFVSKSIEGLADQFMDDFIYKTNGGRASLQYDFYIR